MLRKILASLATLAIGVGLAVTAALPAHATDSNQESYWVTEDGETCVKTDFTEPKPASYTLSAGFLAGKDITKVIIKAGSSNGNGPGAVTYENTAYYEHSSVAFGAANTWWVQVADLATETYVHRDGPIGGPVSPSGKGISHVIVCYTTVPTSVFGDATVQAQTCDESTYTLVDGWIAPVATTGVTYELYAADKTTLIDGTFDAQTSLAFGTYWVKVLPASSSYTVSDANTWLERVVGEFDGRCAPTSVFGDATVQAQTCDVSTYTLVDGWIAPDLTKTGVTYELYAADKTTLIDGTFDAQTSVAFGTYWVKVLPASDSYTVSEANTWLERVVAALGDDCIGEIKTLGDPFDTQECVAIGDEELPSTWSATLTIVPADHVQYRVFFHDGLVWDEQGLWVPGVYTAGPGGDFPYGTKIKVVAEAVGNYTLTANPHVWEYEFTQPFNCQQSTEGTVTPVVTFAQTCSAGATYTLAIEGGVAGTVLFSLNGGPTTQALGTFAVGSPSSISIVATPGPGSGFDNAQDNELTFTKEFPALAACGDLTTLALTGDNVTPTLWVAGLLGLLGTALVRSARRFSRVTAQH